MGTHLTFSCLQLLGSSAHTVPYNIDLLHEARVEEVVFQICHPRLRPIEPWTRPLLRLSQHQLDEFRLRNIADVSVHSSWQEVKAGI
jgi:hypothetical protein